MHIVFNSQRGEGVYIYSRAGVFEVNWSTNGGGNCHLGEYEITPSSHPALDTVLSAEKTMSAEAIILRRKVEILTAEISDILLRAYHYDDKPHQLFSGLRVLALAHSGDMTEEIIRLMDAAYEKARA